MTVLLIAAGGWLYLTAAMALGRHLARTEHRYTAAETARLLDEIDVYLAHPAHGGES